MIRQIKHIWLRLLRRDPISLMDKWSKRVGTEEKPITEQNIRDAMLTLPKELRLL